MQEKFRQAGRQAGRQAVRPSDRPSVRPSVRPAGGPAGRRAGGPPARRPAVHSLDFGRCWLIYDEIFAKIMIFHQKGVKIQKHVSKFKKIILTTARKLEVSRICRPIDFPSIFHPFLLFLFVLYSYPSIPINFILFFINFHIYPCWMKRFRLQVRTC